ncbi:MAG: HAD-IA family hydrolase [Candidatus Anstonellales archaeon]
MFKHVIFDLDNTIVALNVEWDSARKEVIEYIKQIGVRIESEEHFSLWEMPFRVPQFRKHKKEIDKIFEKWERKAIEEGKPQKIGYAVELIEKINGKVMGIVSNNTHSTIELILGNIGIRDKFKYVIGRDDTFEIKPLPGIVEMAIKKSGVPKEESLFVGDSRWDFIAGSSAGVPVFLMRNKEDAKTLEYILNLTL